MEWTGIGIVTVSIRSSGIERGSGAAAKVPVIRPWVGSDQFLESKEVMEDLSIIHPSLKGRTCGVAELRYHGELRAHLLLSMASMGVRRDAGGAPWLWLTVRWLDGRTEPPLEDYGPEWIILDELKSGRLTFQQEPSVTKKSRIFGEYSINRSPDIKYEVRWSDGGC